MKLVLPISRRRGPALPVPEYAAPTEGFMPPEQPPPPPMSPKAEGESSESVPLVSRQVLLEAMNSWDSSPSSAAASGLKLTVKNTFIDVEPEEPEYLGSRGSQTCTARLSGGSSVLFPDTPKHIDEPSPESIWSTTFRDASSTFRDASSTFRDASSTCSPKKIEPESRETLNLETLAQLNEAEELQARMNSMFISFGTENDTGDLSESLQTSVPEPPTYEAPHRELGGVDYTPPPPLDPPGTSVGRHFFLEAFSGPSSPAEVNGLRLTVKNTFLDIDADEEKDQRGTQTCTARLSNTSPQLFPEPDNEPAPPQVISRPPMLPVPAEKVEEPGLKMVVRNTFIDIESCMQMENSAQSCVARLAGPAPQLLPPTPVSGLMSSNAAGSLPMASSQGATFQHSAGQAYTNSVASVAPISPLSATSPSIGSRVHGARQADGSPVCQPCAWFYKESGCLNGLTCRYCHLCPHGELKSRKKAKIQRLRSQEASIAAMVASTAAAQVTAHVDARCGSAPQKVVPSLVPPGSRK